MKYLYRFIVVLSLIIIWGCAGGGNSGPNTRKDISVHCPCGYKCAGLQYDETKDETYCRYCSFRVKGIVYTLNGYYDKNRWVINKKDGTMKKLTPDMYTTEWGKGR